MRPIKEPDWCRAATAGTPLPSGPKTPRDGWADVTGMKYALTAAGFNVRTLQHPPKGSFAVGPMSERDLNVAKRLWFANRIHVVKKMAEAISTSSIPNTEGLRTELEKIADMASTGQLPHVLLSAEDGDYTFAPDDFIDFIEPETEYRFAGPGASQA